MRMADYRDQRLQAISDLIRSRPIASQEELADGLAALGYSVTQATISRDLEQLGAIKVRRDNRLTYAMPQQLTPGADGPEMRVVVRDWVRSVDFAGNLVILRTPPGSAHLVGVALDRAELPEVAGTICGDDTVFVAVRDAKRAPEFARRLEALRQ
jgi:transcriptional regulator of arginine metabolism